MNQLPIEKEDVINALKVLRTMLKHAGLSSHDVATLMIQELDEVDFVPATKTEQKLDEVVKFNKSFDTLYKISMSMADECIGAKEIEARFGKLEEEYQELIEAFAHSQKTLDNSSIKLVKGELADVLFVLLHIAHKFNFTPFELLHQASSKMLSRMADSSYKAKN